MLDIECPSAHMEYTHEGGTDLTCQSLNVRKENAITSLIQTINVQHTQKKTLDHSVT